MLSIEIKATRFVGDKGNVKMDSIAHVQIINTVDHPNRPDYGNYRWRIQQPDGGIIEGILENHLRSDGALALLFKVLAMWMIANENKAMVGELVGSLLTINDDRM
jgi:hypothetical protein